MLNRLLLASIVLLIPVAVAVMPWWPYTPWGYGPAGMVAATAVVLSVLLANSRV